MLSAFTHDVKAFIGSFGFEQIPNLRYLLYASPMRHFLPDYFLEHNFPCTSAAFLPL